MVEIDNKVLRVYYGVGYGRYKIGNINNIPKDAFVAEIVHNYITNDLNMNNVQSEKVYKFFVGKVYKTTDLLKQIDDYNIDSRLEQFISEGYDYTFIPKGKDISDGWFYSFDRATDKLFDNYEDFKNSIEYTYTILSNYNSNKPVNNNKLLHKIRSINN